MVSVDSHPMTLDELFRQTEEALLAKSREAGFVEHLGDRGENREELLRDFLQSNLPRRYGVGKGAAVARDGQQTHSADVVIYDALDCPILYSGRTQVFPIEGVYGIIEVKSRLSKAELLDACDKIRAFKELAPRELSVITTREGATVHRPSRPFAIVLAFQLADNSLDSLSKNWDDKNKEIHTVNNFANLVAVLGSGLVHYELADLAVGEKRPLLDTDEFVDIVLTRHKRERAGEPSPDLYTRVVIEESGVRTLGRFFVYLLVMLARLKLGAPDLGRYLDPDMPILIRRES
jgi:hypothetical protein